METTPLDFARLAKALNLTPAQVEAVVTLSDEGNTVPFITRYRKERTGNLDEEKIREILALVAAERELIERRTAILKQIESQGKITPELKSAIESADSLKRLEDLYAPYKPRKRTRASIARDRGLEPLAELIWSGHESAANLNNAAKPFVHPDKEVPDTAAALQGASDILAEKISDDPQVRGMARNIAWKTGRLITSAGKVEGEAAQPFRDYFEYDEGAAKIPPHRVLAINRGESSDALRVKFDWDGPQSHSRLSILLGFSRHRCGDFLNRVLTDSLDRLILPSLEREIRRELTEKAEEHAVGVFARNLRNLLLQPPLPGKRVLAVDPGFRTGCKIAVLDENGNRQLSDVLYLVGSSEKKEASKARLAELLKEHHCSIVAIGNGTACRETEELVAEVIAESAPDVRYVIVNEAGASIYSTSPIARDEFPDDNATARGTISIGRRLQDPLSELVKIEPQHIGVGMYQHDVDAKRLEQSLEQVVESCVNYVGVDLNTASAPLLCRVSGLTKTTAKRITEYRQEHGPFRKRAQLKEVAGIGPAAFTQAAGFLKIRGGDEPLDGTWIHPESYPVARQILKRLNVSSTEAITSSDSALREKLNSLDAVALSRDLDAGLPTVKDILDSLSRPGRDPRADAGEPLFRRDILQLEDLKPGMELRGTVGNVVDFGAFVDIGVKESGLVHISRMSNQFVKSPHDHVSVGDVVTVWVLSIDEQRKRVSLSMVPPT